MSAGQLEALAVRCEQATGPDAYADYLIHAAVMGWRTPDELNCFSWCVGENYQFGDPADERRAIYISESDLPTYTHSVDAALTLVPHGWRFIVDSDGCHCRMTRATREGRDVTGFAGTIALAITAAALRAASADTHPKDGDAQRASLVSGAVPNGETPQ